MTWKIPWNWKPIKLDGFGLIDASPRHASNVFFNHAQPSHSFQTD
ncbi:hypothetical protein RBWH47_05456 [Rhodopirellula baltica WH47]|uniref:Uncharacterized protein n=2 Tax=Rhodopirellula baltica TaxID=265606 RepID=F2AUU8_RHOBT|nr:hypothetical protein RBWH47_05456 [Rhodopirellula baltica WH47]ELP34733.1 hypothetical protein RBSWK_01240 [Rhodopirellula baltica SWK14]